VTASDAEPSNSIELAAEIVAAFVASNSLPIAELPALIHSVHASLEKLASGPRLNLSTECANSGKPISYALRK
jgi:predicted transcriptional regulator